MNRSSTCRCAGLIILLLLSSCGNAPQKVKDVIVETRDSIVSTHSSPSYSLKTFKSDAGWGYDIYTDSVKMIHQPTIPAVPGIRSFKTEEDAARTGNYAISKMQGTGSFPTLSVQELDSLGVLK